MRGQQPSAETPHAPSPVTPDQPEEPARWDPVAERDARREARAALRGPRASGAQPSKHRSRVPVERIVTSAAIVVMVVAIAVLVGSLGPEAWVLGLVCSSATLALVSVLPAATPRRPEHRRHPPTRSRR